ncbi:hypothetical protein ACJIZ3_007748 [Penstemon smallii]|uniref:Reverse transcriptase domain-containing protein n=1 Tax=Penstemon smallii TaxID=265156 RepID=A0ABD3T7U0_9LAMI
MRALAWNCQGLGKPKAGRTLRALLRECKPDILFLSEIKTSKFEMITSLLTTNSLPNHVFVPPLGKAGGLCLAWRNPLNVQITMPSLSPTLPYNRGVSPVFTAPFPMEIDQLFPSIIDDEENTTICKLPTPKEIKQVMFSFTSGKSPGPDGLPALFYKNFWSTTGNALVQAVQHFFRTGFMLKALNHTFVTLIPKVVNATSVDQFRPISLCNVSYKVISKIIANRLKPLLQKIVSPNQMAFVHGRNINENSIISQEIMHYMHTRKGKKGFLALKVDLSKAYDRVEWKLLLHILEKVGVCSKFTNWIAQCIMTCSYSFLINGVPFGFVRPGRGIRQGDPLSPYLFIIYTELLSRLLIKEECNASFRGVKIARTAPTISHILYADDLVIYCRAIQEDVNTIVGTLEKFSTWSGQIINPDKSSIHYSKNVATNFKDLVLSQFGFKECDHKTKHLGLPFCKPRSRSAAFNEILLKLKQKLSGWKSKNLSQAGRGVLLKAVAQALPMYPMSTFLLPKTMCDSMDAIMRKFWWGTNQNGHSLMLKSWSSICIPKCLGGLGFRRSEDFNKALIAKLAWNVATRTDKLWIQLLGGKYLRERNLLDIAKAPNNASWVWQDIVKCIDGIKKGACFNVTPNSIVPTWTAPWIPSMPSFIPNPKMDCPLDPNEFNTVNRLFNPISGDWDMITISELFPPEVAREISKIIISPPNSITKLLWTPSKSRNFTTKSCYITSQACRFPQISQNDAKLFKNLWSAKLHNRHKFLIWRIIHDLLPTRKRLYFIVHRDSPCCPICKGSDDSIEHLFFHCPFTAAIWFHSKWNLRIVAFHHLSFRDWIAALLVQNMNLFPSDSIREEFLIFVACTFDCVWFYRNSLFHNKSAPLSIQELSLQISKQATSHYSAQKAIQTTKHLPNSFSGWLPPPKGWFKANSDAAFKNGDAALAVVIRNSSGSVVFASSRSTPCINAKVAEALAIRDACKFLNEIGVHNIIFECDCLLVVQAILFWEENMDWAISSIILEIREFWASWPKWRFKFVSRSVNCAAHNLAAWAFPRSLSLCLSPDCLPISLFCDGGYPLVNWLTFI